MPFGDESCWDVDRELYSAENREVFNAFRRWVRLGPNAEIACLIREKFTGLQCLSAVGPVRT